MDEGIPLKKADGYTCRFRMQYHIDCPNRQYNFNGLPGLPWALAFSPTADVVLTYDTRGEFVSLTKENDTLRQAKEASFQQLEQITVQKKAQAEAFGHQAAQQILNMVGGGQNVRINVENWYYGWHTGEYKISVGLYFNGAIIRNNEYAVGGALTVQENGQNPRFRRTFANEAFERLENRIRFLEGAVIALDTFQALRNK